LGLSLGQKGKNLRHRQLLPRGKKKRKILKYVENGDRRHVNHNLKRRRHFERLYGGEGAPLRHHKNCDPRAKGECKIGKIKQF
jgi:hypothetical protein